MYDIYLDNAATTNPHDYLEDIYKEYSYGAWQNPSALYKPSVEAGRRMKASADMLLAAFGSRTHRCVFTSCGSEGANTVILRGVRNKKNMNYVCGGFEHPCVDECFRQLSQSGADVRFIPADDGGLVEAGRVLEAVDENTALVSVMHVNNETGAKTI
jgi:cysteine desulfurase